jgi:hypothetical protein
MKKVEHGKTFDRNAANPPAFEIFHNTVTEGYPEHWHTAIEIIMPTRGEYESEKTAIISKRATSL